MTPRLRFRPDGTFTIVQFTDVHWQNGEPFDQQSRALMAGVLDQEQPDLVLFTGDLIEGDKCRDPRESYRQATAAVVERQIPWAAVFGNHDDEGSATRADLMAAQQQLPFCLSEPGPAEIAGVGNYVLRVADPRSSEVAALLYCLDSGAYAPRHLGRYGWIERSQIAWYLQQSAALQAQHGPVPALAFFHIPLPEYNEVWDFHTCTGHKFEGICCPQLNSGFFQALAERGEVLGTFVGHDHVNDFCGELHGIRLCYGRASGYGNYGHELFLRGARVIQLHQGERRFTSWLRLVDGSRVAEQPQHAPAGRVLSSY